MTPASMRDRRGAVSQGCRSRKSVSVLGEEQFHAARRRARLRRAADGIEFEASASAAPWPSTLPGARGSSVRRRATGPRHLAIAPRVGASGSESVRSAASAVDAEALAGQALGAHRDERAALAQREARRDRVRLHGVAEQFDPARRRPGARRRRGRSCRPAPSSRSSARMLLSRSISFTGSARRRARIWSRT